MSETNNTKPNFFRRLFVFGTTPRVALNFLGMILATFLLLWMVFFSLKCYTRHGKTYEVPDYVKQDVKDILAEAKKSRFDVVVIDSTYVKGMPGGMIIEQDPKPMSRAKQGRKVYLTINRLTRPLRKIPNLYGDGFEDAVFRLQALNLNHKVIKKVVDPRSPGTVKAVFYDGKTIVDKENKYKGGAEAPAGDTIELIVAEDYDAGNTQIPDLVCLPYNDAVFAISNHNLALGTVRLDATVLDTLTAFVSAQYPPYEAGRMMRVGEQVDLTLTQTQPLDCGMGDIDVGNYEGNGNVNDAPNFEGADDPRW